jgi:voltage-gated potassium channel Kch
MTHGDGPPARSAKRAALRRGWRWFRPRGVALVAVFACGFLAFSLGAEVSDRPYVATAHWITKLYYTLGLFVLGGLDLGVPSGGPTTARVLLWISYFSAPAITASALVEAAVRVAGQGHWWLLRLRNHVVVAGAGRLGMTYLEWLRARNPSCRLVVVDAGGPTSQLDVAREALNALTVAGDISSDAVLANLRVEHAERVLLLTDNDFANLDAAAKILDAHPNLSGRIVAHVSDLELLRALTGTRLAEQIETFNTHEIAATHLVTSSLVKHFDSTERVDSVVIAGFGRFGQSLLLALDQHAPGRFDLVIIADTRARRRVREFEDEHGSSSDRARQILDGDVSDPELWDQVFAALGNRNPVIVVGTGDDRANVRAALSLAADKKGSKIVARTIEHVAVATRLAREGRFESFAVLDLISQSIPERWCP